MSSNFSRVLLCAGVIFISFEANAVDINCSSDLIAGIYDDGGPSAPYAGAYGRCVVGGNLIVVLYRDSGSIIAGKNNIIFTPPAPTSVIDLGAFSSLAVADMGTTEPTLSNCIAATYSGASVSAVIDNWYCAKFVGGTNTGYMAAKWNSVTFIPSALAPPTLPPVSAPINMNFKTQVETTSTDIEIK